MLRSGERGRRRWAKRRLLRGGRTSKRWLLAALEGVSIVRADDLAK